MPLSPSFLLPALKLHDGWESRQVTIIYHIYFVVFLCYPLLVPAVAAAAAAVVAAAGGGAVAFPLPSRLSLRPEKNCAFLIPCAEQR